MSVLIDGFSTTIELAGCTLSICEKTVTPPEIDAGTAIDITTMRNTKWRTFAPKYLRTLGQITVNASYDPFIYVQGVIQGDGVVGTVQLISINFPDGTTLRFYGYVEKVTPQEIKEGEQPVVQITITPTQWSGTFLLGCPVEVGPSFGLVSSHGNFRTC